MVVVLYLLATAPLRSTVELRFGDGNRRDPIY
jgi:hypothetical protein